MIRFLVAVLTVGLFASVTAYPGELLTNSARFTNAPKWLNLSRVNRVSESVTRMMDWSVRRVEVQWFSSQAEFEGAHSLGPFPVAVSQHSRNRILLGPKVNESNFDRVFAHELAHVSSAQKYKGAIPQWLEEGVANYVAQFGKVDYVKMMKHPLPDDVTLLSHPVRGSEEEVANRYAASQALIEMIASRCDFRNLLRISVRRKMENYLENICRIKDINQSFRDWVKEQAAKTSEKTSGVRHP